MSKDDLIKKLKKINRQLKRFKPLPLFKDVPGTDKGMQIATKGDLAELRLEMEDDMQALRSEVEEDIPTIEVRINKIERHLGL